MRRIIPLTAIAVTLAALCAANVSAADDDTPEAAATRKKLQTKVTFKFKEVPLKEALDDIKEETKVTFIIDSKGGVSGNQKVSLDVKDVTLAEALDKMLGKNGLGYIVLGKGNAYNGSLFIKQGKERGDPIKDK